MFVELQKYLSKPELYTNSSGNFWDDEHISKGLLEAHLNPSLEAATRKHDFLDESVKWIGAIAPPNRYKNLLDLGCGPGLYAERFSDIGYIVTGIDFSKRSIDYAKWQTRYKKSKIKYHYQNYLTINYNEQFDVIVMIYCDYAVLPATDRAILIKKAYDALKTGGILILDVFTPQMRKPECHTWQYSPYDSFWSEIPHLTLESVFQYDDADLTELSRYIVLTKEGIRCYNIWNHYFTKESLLSEILSSEFSNFELYGDVAGNDYSDASETICGVFTK
ncbi:MAG: class I SAM-dependent methyltransferase [Bacteroidales bacterium]|nr:class I SAM-dependent methyltransferase [Bacteroidales bacterium]